MCHVSHVMCHVLGVTCHMSHVTCHSQMSQFFFRQSGEASQWRVSYQRGYSVKIADTGKARGFSTNTFVTDSLTD